MAESLVSQEDVKTFEVTDLKACELKAYHLYQMGSTISEIAKIFNKGDRTIHRWVDKVKSTLPYTIEDDEINKKLKNLLPTAIENIESLMSADNERVKLDANLKIVQSQGYLIEQSKVEHSGKVKNEVDISEKLDNRIGSLISAIGGVPNGKE